MIVPQRICYAYFRGSDGLGTCDNQCQWYKEGFDCPMWIPRDLWESRLVEG